MSKQTTGSYAQVMHGSAEKTAGGLTKNDLMYNKRGKIVSKAKHAAGLNQAHFLGAHLGDTSQLKNQNKGKGIESTYAAKGGNIRRDGRGKAKQVLGKGFLDTLGGIAKVAAPFLSLL